MSQFVLPGSNEPLSAWAAERKAHLAGRPVVVSVSGGKDSTAVCLLLLEAEIDFRCVHMDTGWEHEATERYVRETLPGIVGPIQILQGTHGGMEGLVKHKGMFPSRVRRFCTQELKVRPFQRFLASLDDEPVNPIGIRTAESAARAKMEEWDFNAGFDCEVWRPIIRWSFDDVIAIHQRHGVAPNPLYLKGATRVGCWPCIFSRKSEIRQVADLDPGQIDRLERLEAEVGVKATERRVAKGLPLADYSPPTFFQDPIRRTNPTTGEVARGCVPIREVVEWSRTAHGGKQAELFAPPYDDGCMRWGMCETQPPESEPQA